MVSAVFSNNSMKILGIVTLFGLIIWIAARFHRWDDEKNDGFGCVMIAIISTILIFILGAVSMCKSCISDSNNSPSYDYYDDRAR